MKDESGILWERVSSERGPDLGLFKARYDWMRHPTGDPTLKRLVLESPDWANCVATAEDGRFVLVEQYRFGLSDRTLEPPGGSVEPGETPLEAAQRELLEETGYGGGTWTYLGAVEPNPALHPHLCHHFRATDVRRIAEPSPGPGEVLRVELASLYQLRQAIRSGRMRHALALTAMMRVFNLMELLGRECPAASLTGSEWSELLENGESAAHHEHQESR